MVAMTAKEYLTQARHLDQQIDAKIRQVDRLRELATKATAAFSGMPHGTDGGHSRTADCIERIVDLQMEINEDIDRLVDLKREIHETVQQITDGDLRTIIERRYICLDSWEAVAVRMGYEYRYLLKRHGNALEAVQKILDEREKRH